MTDQEIKALTDLLAMIEPGFLPLSVFTEVARVYVSAIVEIVPLRSFKGKIQVLLVRREINDPFWPNKLHTPGTVLRPSDKTGSVEDAFNRILDGELGYLGERNPVFVKMRLSKSSRGSEFAAVYYLEILEEVKNGEWFDADDLPEDLVQVQDDLIKMAVESYKKNKS